MTPQSAITIIAPIAPEREAALRELLALMCEAPGAANPRNELFPFYQFGSLHVARFVIIEALTNDDMLAHGETPSPWRPALGFVADVDGPANLFMAEMAVRAGSGLRRLFSHCLGFNEQFTDLLAWMKRHNVRTQALYTNWRGRTVNRVHEEQALAGALREQAAALLAERGSREPRALFEDLLQHVQDEQAAGRLRLSREEPTPPGWFIRNTVHLLGVPAVLLALAPLAIIIAPWFFWRLRRLERSDPENLLPPTPDHVKLLTDQEDIDVTNHFNVFGQVKPGKFRRATIRLLLALLDYAARHVYHRGYLTRIRTIHFARWVLLDRNRRVYFASNYDGSADSYMDDFINKVAWGLNLVFSNGVGYPRSRWLIKGGAEYEEKYKNTLRRNQLPSGCWYKAYPGLTAVDLERNTRIRRGLELARPGDKAIRKWLELL